jgi:ABC-type antimicrobial peptide transport system permease subunit
MIVLGGFAGLALLLALVGVHGVLSYTVAQRTREIGVRMALGAERRDVVTLVLKQGAVLIAGGLALGLLGSLALTSVLRSMMYGISVRDPATLLGVAIALGAVALLACWLPALRASTVDPTVALRSE